MLPRLNIISTLARPVTLASKRSPTRALPAPRIRTMGTVFPTVKSSATDLLTALPQKFEEAKQSGELFFFPSTARDVQSEGYRFNLRSCPALLDKQKAKKEALANQIRTEKTSPDAKRPRRETEGGGSESGEDNGNGNGKQNAAEPFKPPYVEELFVGALDGIEGEEGMSILLNKYSLLPEHMLLCPFAYQPQSLPPTPPQLALAHHIIHSASRHPTRPRKLLGFYNGGPGAGASQTWRHFQFIEVGNGAPVEEWIRGTTFEKRDEPKIVPGLPYLHIVHPLPDASGLPFPPTPESNEQVVDVLAPAMMKMLDIAFDALRQNEGDRSRGWNLLLTLDHIHLIPRSSPSYPLGEPHEPLELNSLGYAGLMLVRSEEEEKRLLELVEGKGGLMEVLKACGIPRQWGEKAVDTGMALHAGDQYML